MIKFKIKLIFPIHQQMFRLQRYLIKNCSSLPIKLAQTNISMNKLSKNMAGNHQLIFQPIGSLISNRLNFCTIKEKKYRKNGALNSTSSRIQVLRQLINEEEPLDISDLMETSKWFKVNDTKSLIKIEETFYEYCRLLQKGSYQNLTPQQTLELGQICYNLKVLCYNEKSFPRIFRTFRRNFIDLVTHNQIIISKITSIDVLCRLYAIMNQQNHFKILFLLSKAIKDKLMAKMNDNQEIVSTDNLIQMLKSFSKAFDLSSDEKKLAEMALIVLSTRKNQLSYLQIIKLYFAYEQAVGFLGGKNQQARSFTKQINMITKSFPQKYNQLGFETIAYIISEAPIWEPKNVSKLHQEILIKWIQNLEIDIKNDPDEDYEDIRKDVYIFESLVLSGQNIEILKPKNRKTIIQFLKKIMRLFAEQPKNARLRTVVTEVFDMQFLNKQIYLNQILPEFLQNFQKYSNKLQIIYQLACRKIFDKKIAQYLSEQTPKSLHENMKRADKINNVKLIVSMQRYSCYFQESPQLLRDKSKQVELQVKKLSKLPYFILFTAGIQRQLCQVTEFHRIYQSLFFKELSTQINKSSLGNFYLYIVAMCSYKELAWLKSSIQDHISLKELVNLIKFRDARKMNKKSRQNLIYLIHLALQNQIIMSEELFSQYYIIVSFLGDPFLQYSIKPSFSSKYFELLKFLFDKFYFTPISEMDSDAVDDNHRIENLIADLRKKLVNLVIALFTREIVNIKDNFQYILFIRYLLSKLDLLVNNILINQLILKGLQLNELNKSHLQLLNSHENFQLRLYQQYHYMHQLLMNDDFNDFSVIEEKYPYLLFRNENLLKDFEKRKNKIKNNLNKLGVRELCLSIFHFGITKNYVHFYECLGMVFKIMIEKMKVPERQTKNAVIRKIVELVEKNQIVEGKAPELQEYLYQMQVYHGSVTYLRIEELHISNHYNLIDLCQKFPKSIYPEYFEALLNYMIQFEFTASVYLKILFKINECSLLTSKKYFNYIQNKLENAEIRNRNLLTILVNINGFNNPLESVTKILAMQTTFNRLCLEYISKKYPILKETVQNLAIQKNDSSLFVDKGAHIFNKILVRLKQENIDYQEIRIGIKETDPPNLIRVNKNKLHEKIYGVSKNVGIGNTLAMKKMTAVILGIQQNHVAIIPNIYYQLAQVKQKGITQILDQIQEKQISSFKKIK